MISNNKYFLYLVIFATGFGIPAIYIPLMVVYIFLTFNTYIIYPYNKEFISYYVLVNVFVQILFLIGYSNMNISNPLNKYFLYTFCSVFIIPVVYSNSPKHSFEIVISYLLGAFIMDIYTVYYNFMYMNFLSLYNNVFNPFTGELINSPSYSNVLTIVFCGIMNLLIKTSSSFTKIFSIIILIICSVAAAYLGGRAYFIIISLFLILSSYNSLLSKKIAGLSIIFITIWLLWIIIYPIIEPYTLNLINRFDEKGADSGRYALWVASIKDIPFYPFGGFILSDTLDSKWSHNLWLDVARLSGWVPLLFLVIINSKFVLLFNKIKKNYYDLWLLGVVCLLVMSQDVIIEGSPIIFIAYIIINSVMLSFANNNITYRYSNF